MIVCYGAASIVAWSVFSTRCKPIEASILIDSLKHNNVGVLSVVDIISDDTGADQRPPWPPPKFEVLCSFDIQVRDVHSSGSGGRMNLIAATVWDHWLLGTRLFYRNSDHISEHRLQWDPGGFFVVSAWGQAEFQGGRDVRTLSYSYTPMGWPFGPRRRADPCGHLQGGYLLHRHQERQRGRHPDGSGNGMAAPSLPPRL